MKRRTSKLLSVLLIATLVFTSVGTAFAAEGDAGGQVTNSVKEIETAGAAQPQQLQQVQKNVESKEDLAELKAAQGNFQVRNITTGTEADFNATPVTQIAYGINETVSGNKKGYAQAISLKKGTVEMQVAAYGFAGDGQTATTSGSIYFGVYRDKALTQPVDSERVNTVSNENSSSGVFSIPATGTYYLGVYSTITTYSTTQIYVAQAAVAYLNGTDRTLTHKKWSVVGLKKAQTNYMKFKASYTGYVKVTTQSFSGKMTLTNSKKKALSNAVAVSTSRPYVVFGVKKGVTYYVKMASNANSDGAYRLYYANAKITEKSGAKKAKAVTIKAKKTKKGNIIAGSGTVDWYKFKLTGKKKVVITMKGATNNKMKIALYKGNKLMKTSTFSKNTASIKLTSSGKLPKGTYYIRVYRGTSTSSGWYSLYWK